MNKRNRLRLAAGATALGALAIVAAGGPATASVSEKGSPTTIKMERDGREFFFEGPATVEAGTKLKIKNNTNPAAGGPHTFSLVREKDLPQSRKQIKNCEKKLRKICGAIIKWHKVDLQTGEVGENPVEVGKQGWDRKGSLKRKGDSWVSERKNQSFKRKVTADPGKSLTFICAVHAAMQGEIEVVED